MFEKLKKPKNRQQSLLIFGVLLIFIFLIAIYMGPLKGTEKFGWLGLKKQGQGAKAASPTTLGSIIEPGSMVTEANYVIFIDGTNYYARNGKTGEIQFSGTDACVVMQLAKNALSSGGMLQLTEGTFNCAVTDATPGIGFGGNITLAGVSMAATTINITAHSKWGPNIYVDGNSNVLRDLTVNGAGTSATNVELSVMVVGSDNTLLRVRSKNSSPVKVGDVSSSNFRIEGPGARNKVIDCVSEGGLDGDPNSGGFFVYHSSDVYIENLYSHNNARSGLLLFPDEGDTISVINYRSENEGRSGIFFIPTSGRSRLAKDIQIINPTIRRAGDMGIDGSSIGSPIYAPVSIRGGLVEGSAGNGVDLNRGWGWEAIGTISRLSGFKKISGQPVPEGFGFAGGPQDKVRLINVRAESNWSAGIAIFGANGAVVDSATVINNGLGGADPIINDTQTKGVFIFNDQFVPPSRDNIIKNSIFNDTQATAPKSLTANAVSGQKTIKINPADTGNFFSGQTVEIKEGANSEPNYIDSVNSSDGTLVMFRNLKRNYSANVSTIQGKATQGSGIDEYSSSDYNLFENNSFKNMVIPISIVGAHSIARNNFGYTTENSGTATIASGSFSKTFAHGLATTPSVIVVTPQGNPGSGGIWVSAKDPTNITVNRSGTSGDLPISWRAEVK